MSTVIDTAKLFNAVDAYEEKLLNEKHGGDWEHCPMSFLDVSEKRVIQRRALIEQIENLMNDMVAADCYK